MRNLTKKQMIHILENGLIDNCSEDVCKLLKLKKNDLRRSESSIIDELVRNYLQDGEPNGQ